MTAATAPRLRALANIRDRFYQVVREIRALAEIDQTAGDFATSELIDSVYLDACEIVRHTSALIGEPSPVPALSEPALDDDDTQEVPAVLLTPAEADALYADIIRKHSVHLTTLGVD